MTVPGDGASDTSISGTQRSFASQVALIARLLRKRFDERARAMAMDGEEALSQAQWRALATIHLNSGCTQKELAERLEIGPVATGQTIDRLERLGWVERKADAGDRRVNRLHVTRAALPILHRLGLLPDSDDPYACIALPHDKMAQLTALLDEVIISLSQSS